MFRIDDRETARWMTLDRNGTRNAVPNDGWEALRAAFSDFDRSDQRVLVITGANGDFCAGADVSGLTDSDEPGIEPARRAMERVDRAAVALRRLTKPTIAAVEGVAAGAGMNLALGCDVVIASETARFTEVFVKRGLMLDFGGTWLLPRHVGLQRAKELAYSGRIVEGPEAAAIGLAMEVVDPESLLDRAEELAAIFAAGAPLAQMFTKTGIERALASTFEEALAFETTAQSVCLNSEDVVEGVTSFFEKRSPVFRGR